MTMVRSSTPLYEQIHALVSRVPPGYVTTYGDVARVVGTTARVIGFAMAALHKESNVPWQRVINSRGMISTRREGVDRENIQRVLLESEGIQFDQRQRVDLSRYRWDFSGLLRTKDFL